MLDASDSTCESCGTDAAEWFVRGVVSGRESALCRLCLSRQVALPQNPLDVVRKHLAQMSPARRARVCAVLASDLSSELAVIRSAAVRELHDELGSWVAVGHAIGVSAARAVNLATGADRTRRENAKRERRIRSGLDLGIAVPAAGDHPR